MNKTKNGTGSWRIFVMAYARFTIEVAYIKREN